MALIEKREIRERYDGVARWFDLIEGLPELLGLRRLRRELARKARGRVLEVAAGTGKTLRHYPRGCRVFAADLSPGMLALARRKVRRRGGVPMVVADAERMAFRDGSFDTVVDTLSLCTFRDPVGALSEMARVCRPEGRILLLEHGRSDRPRLGRWQDRHAEGPQAELGCRWNREPLALVRAAGLEVAEARRTLFGVLHLMELRSPGVETGLSPERRMD